jgi:hypothetical protein
VTLATRQEAVATLEEGDARVRELLEGISEDDLVRTRTIGNGTWSAKDLVGHLATWEGFALESLAQWRSGRRPQIEAVLSSIGTRPLNRLNAERNAAKRALSWEEIRWDADATHRQLVAKIEGMTDEEWASKAPYPTAKRGRLALLLGSVLGAPQRPFGHAFAHIPDLEAFVERLRGPAA